MKAAAIIERKRLKGLVLVGADHNAAIDEEDDQAFGEEIVDRTGRANFADSMQVERVPAGFQLWENKVENNNVVVAEQAAANVVVSVPADDTIVPESGSEVAAYQPRNIASLPLVSSDAGSQRRVSSPTLLTPSLPSPPPTVTPTTAASSLLLHHESCGKKHSPVSLVADKYMILDELEGSSLNMCINIHTKEDYVCKVSYNVVYIASRSPNRSNPRWETIIYRFV